MDFQYEGFRVADGHIIIEMHLPMPVNTDLISSESVNTESITTAPVTTAHVTTAPVTTAHVNAVSTYIEPIEENFHIYLFSLSSFVFETIDKNEVSFC